MAWEPTVLEGRFVLGESIGEGSFSVVHAAVDQVTGRSVAVKISTADRVYDASVRHWFEREASALAVIASAHVVELISAGTADDGRPFLVLERLDGHDLQDAIVRRGPLTPAQVVRVVGEAAAALELAHGLGIVHRDLKPANLFLHTTAAGTPIVKVLDFGMVVDTTGPTARERDGFGGTPLYMAPEQVRGQLTRIGPATDVWALAMVTTTLLTGESYWTGITTEDVMAAIENAVIEPPSRCWPWLPASFDAWFARATQRVPERRFRSVAAQAAQLAEALRGVHAPERARAAALTGAESTMVGPTPTPSLVRQTQRGSIVVGRQLERAEIERLLAPGVVVTLTGTAGIGKSRLARAVYETAGDRHVDGAWFVTLTAGAGDGQAEIAGAIADAIGLEPDATRPLLEHLAASLAPRRLLLVVDGVEPTPEAAGAIEHLRRACPGVSWLVTARLPLGLVTERRIGIDPLDVPGPGPIGAGEAATFAAVELFVHSAGQALPSFALDDDSVADVVAICRVVEGFPLGIELAAARVATTPLARIRAELEDDRAGDDTPTVRHAVAWSYGLLAPDEQRLLRHLALLPVGLTFAQVTRQLAGVVAEPAYATLRLVQSHLLRWTGDEPRRLVMLATVRELCRDSTRAAGDAPALWRVARSHADEIAGAAASLGQEAWLALLDAEHDNLEAVLTHLLDDEPAVAMRLAGQLAWYWYLRGRYAEGARWLEDAIARGGASGGAELIRALHGAGRLALLGCQYQRAQQRLGRANVLAHDAGDVRGEADAVQLLGSVARERGDYPRARALHRYGLTLWQQLGDRRECGRARNYLVFAAWLGDPHGDPGDEQRDWWQHGDAELRGLGDAEAIVWSQLNRGAILHHRGDRADARDVLGRAFAGSIAAGFHEGIAWSLELLGRASLDRGEHMQARAQLAASLRVHRRLGDRWRCASVLEALAAVAVSGGYPARGAVYLGAAEVVRREIDAPVPACEQALVDATVQRGGEQLGDAFAVGCERGRRTSLDQVVALAHEHTA